MSNTYTDTEIYKLWKKLGSKLAVHKRTGIPRSTIHDKIKRVVSREYVGADEVVVEIATPENGTIIDTDILKQYGLDPKQWKVESISKNAWETPFKDKDDNIISKTNKQTKVLFKKVVPDITMDIIKEHYKMLKQTSPKVPKKMRTREVKDYMYEIAIADHHIAKMCWAEETNESYDIKIAKQLYLDAVYDLLFKVSHLKIDKIILPVGNDLFNSDGMGDMTTSGTPQDTDSRWTKVFRVVSETLIEVIDICSEVADVEILIVPGNHDRASCFYLGEFLDAWYRNNENVNIDNAPTLRKYYRYGKTLIGFTHGSEEKQADLPLIMAREMKEAWGKCNFYEVHIGHFHRKKLTKFIAGDTFNGVTVRILDSLTATDAWHMSKGYVKGIRAATGIIYHKEDGYVGEFLSKVG